MDDDVPKNAENEAVGGEKERKRTGRGIGKQEEPVAGGEENRRGAPERHGTVAKQEGPRQRRTDNTKEGQVANATRQGEGRRGEKEEEGRQLQVDPEEGREDKHAGIQNKYIIGILAFTVLSMTILAIIFLVLLYQREAGSTKGRQSFTEFNIAFREVEASFPNQTARFWRILRNRAAAHLKNPNPKKPLVFMFTAPPSAHNVLNCIASKFARSLDYKDKEMGLVNSTSYQRYTSLEAKKALDEKLKENLENGQTLLVLDVDRLPVKSPLLFYEYCDNENAPYTRAAIIFTVRLPSEPDPSLEPAKAEGLVAQYLRETWGKQDYKMDDIPPLVARMTDTVVMVMNESNETVERNCAT